MFVTIPNGRPIPGLIGTRPPDQIAFLVPDIEYAIAQWGQHRDGNPAWQRYVYDQDFLKESTYLGIRGEFRVRLAMYGNEPQIEFIQSLEGPNIYDDWIDERGYGFHHLGYYVDDLATAKLPFLELGFAEIQSGAGYGLNGDGAFTYFDLVPEIGSVIELIERPQTRKPPLTRY